MCTSAGWAETFIAISNEEDCAEGNEDIGFAGDCGSFPTASAYMMLYLTLSFLIIVNMYIAVILENYTQVCTLYERCLASWVWLLKSAPFLGH